MATIYSTTAHLESLLCQILEQPGSLYVAVGIAVFLCCMVAYEFDGMFERD
jgi:hypothetical protein